jgi:hypothetical protein
VTLARIERDVVEREPQQAAEHDRRKVAARRQRLPPHGDDQAQDDAADQQPPNRERPGPEVRAGGADADERRRPQRDADEPRGRRRAPLRGHGASIAHGRFGLSRNVTLVSLGG